MRTENKKMRFFGIPNILPYVRPYTGKIILMVILGIISSLIDSIYPLFNQHIINHNLALGTNDTLVMVGIGYFLVLAFQVWDNYYSAFMCSKMELWLNRDLRNASFNHLQTLTFDYFNRNSVGYIHARVMSDSGRIGEFVSWRLMDFVWSGSYVVCVIVIMIATNLRLALLVLSLVPVAVVIVTFFRKQLIEQNRRVRELNSTISGDFNEGITGIRAIKTLSVEERMNEEFSQHTRQMEKESVRAGRTSTLIGTGVSFLSSAALALVLWKGGTLTVEKVMELGTLSVFMSYAIGIMEPLQNCINVITAMTTIQVNIERFTKLMETESCVVDTPEVIEKYGDTFHPKKENWEPLGGDVEFKDVTFQYPDGDEPVLEHFNLQVPRGASVAIVGETGAGKSTLVNLVCRFYEPTKGTLLIDGRDARERSQLWLHSHIGYVLQTPHLFSGTVRENLRYGKPDASDEEIWQALRLVSADKVVEKMEKRLDSDVGEGGGMLSTGERQLLSFARAILADPRILVLDEATSSVDTVTEKTIQAAIKTVTAGRTSFMIAHRLSTVVDADMILSVRDGKIVEKGTHKELMAQKGYYFELFTRQFTDISVDMAMERA
ncbi:MAG: ABC transporter ATP-binding protein/permease [Clostridiales bacterium]|nr:ABC transporter ATP-binding protein/permease [Clostridiales bacterium]